MTTSTDLIASLNEMDPAYADGLQTHNAIIYAGVGVYVAGCTCDRFVGQDQESFAAAAAEHATHQQMQHLLDTFEDDLDDAVATHFDEWYAGFKNGDYEAAEVWA